MRLVFGLNFWRRKDVPFEHVYNNEIRIWLFEDWEWMPMYYVGPCNAVFTWLFFSTYIDSKAWRPLYRFLKYRKIERVGYNIKTKED